jgi:flagellar hook protein FlgE
MSISSIGSGFNGFGFAAQGMRDAQARLDVAANNIANATLGPTSTEAIRSSKPVEPIKNALQTPSLAAQASAMAVQTDLTTELTNVMMAKNAFAANAKVMSMQQDMTQSVLDIKG